MTSMAPAMASSAVPAAVPERDRWSTAGIWVVGAAAAALSWTGWWSLAIMCGWNRWLAALLPLSVDVYVITSARVWLRLSWVSARTRRYAAASTCLSVLFSVAANATYHLMTESLGLTRAPWPVVVAVSGLAPLMLALVAHLQARLNADRQSQPVALAESQASAITEATDGLLAVPPIEPPMALTAEPSAVPGPEPQREPSRPAARLSQDPDAKAARDAYRKSVRAGKPLTDRALGKQFSRSRTWAGSRIKECADGPKLAEAR